MLLPLHRWIWGDRERCAHKLLRFGETETGGGRDLVRAAELTGDPLLRRLYLAHAEDELRHGEMFRRRGAEILHSLPPGSTPGFEASWLAPSGHGVDDLSVDGRDDHLLAFLHLSEKAAASRFTVYRNVLEDDTPTRAVFEEILRDEVFHMNYALTQLARVSPRRHRSQLWRARLSRLWKAYLRLATALAGLIGGLLLTIQYFIVLPPFAWLAKRAERRERVGWVPVSPARNGSLDRQY
ncbi:MAG TPA: ferritin-like domain-containing protein [Bryobacteraceae bacterium]|nr:ferritin-like domain-containing protein [Bryobacteraceae bacterium]